MKKSIEEKLDDFDKQIEQASKDEKGFVQTCSKCGSTNVTITQSAAKAYFRELKDVYCRDCNFEGPPILKKIKK